MFYLGLNSSTVARLPLYFFKNLHEYGIVLEEAEKGLLENVVQQLEIEITDLSVSSKKQKKEKEGIHQYSIEGLQRALRRDMTIITETNQLPGMYIQASFITPALKRLTDKYG